MPVEAPGIQIELNAVRAAADRDVGRERFGPIQGDKCWVHAPPQFVPGGGKGRHILLAIGADSLDEWGAGVVEMSGLIEDCG